MFPSIVLALTATGVILMAACVSTSSATLNEAFEKLRQSVISTDAATFQSTTLQDVWSAARDIERVQRKGLSVRNLRRIEPFLNTLEQFSKPIEILCNGTPFLPWLWAPIKLMLQLASQYADVFDRLVSAYVQISESLPRFDRFEKAFQNIVEFQNALALVYADILEFHRRAYKFFRRRAWHIVFDSLWKNFGTRFNAILGSLARHRDLVDKEAMSIDIVEAKNWRIQAQLRLEQYEKERQISQLQDSIAWLAVEDRILEDDLDRLSRRRQPGTCDWVLGISKLVSWLVDDDEEPVLWLKGIPGAGKSVLCSHIIHFLTSRQDMTVAYFFCNSYNDGEDRCSRLLRALVLQVLRAHLDLAPYICDNYANRGRNPSMPQLKKLIPDLLATIPLTRIVIDGLDECQEKDQRLILQELLSLCSPAGVRCKILLSSREGIHLSRALRRKPNICLRERKADVDSDIRLFVAYKLTELRERFDGKIVDDIEKRVVKKADGMFLWVRLVIAMLEDRHSIQELQDAVDELPEGLNEAYGRILNSIMKEHRVHSRDKAIRILEWMACSCRTLKIWEIQDGIVFKPGSTTLNEMTKLAKDILDLCKPIIEEGPGNTVDFVHFSAKEYMLHHDSGPFLREVNAHYNIAFSCISYLPTSLCLVRQSSSEDDLRLQIAKGFHGLHHYASEFWSEHFLRYFSLRENLDRACSGPLLIEQLNKLLSFQKECQSPEFCSESLQIKTLSSISARLSALGSVPRVQGFLHDVLVFREILAQEKHAQKEPEAFATYEAENDPTLFSHIRQRYQAIVESLLTFPGSTTRNGVEQDILDRFRETYGSSAFVCRYSGCPRALDGFISTNERGKHEALHIKRYKCADLTCEFYVPGFTTKGELQRHNRKYHTKPSDAEIPNFGHGLPRSCHPCRSRKVKCIRVPEDPQTRCSRCIAENMDCVDDLGRLQIARKPQLRTGSTEEFNESPTPFSRAGPSRAPELLEQNDPACLSKPLETILDIPEMTQGPFLIRSEQVSVLPHLLEVERPRLAQAVQNLWDIINAQPPQSDSQKAHEALAGLSKKLRSDVRHHQEVLEPATFNQALLDLSLEDVSDHYKKAGTDWYAVFNPRVLRVLDLDLIYTCKTGVVNSIALSPNGSTIATCVGNSIILHSFSGTGIGVEELLSDVEPAWPYRDFTIREACFSPDGKFLAAASSGEVVRIWDLREHTLVHRLRIHEGYVRSLDWSKDARVLASSSNDGTIRLWDPSTGALRSVISCFGKKARCISISPDSRYIAAGVDWSVHIWDCNTGELLDQYRECHQFNRVTSVAFAPSGEQIVGGDSSGKIIIWNTLATTESGKCVKILEGHRHLLQDVIYTSDGAWVLSNSFSGLYFWNPKTGDAEVRLVKYETRPYNGIRRVSSNPRGSAFATLNHDSEIRVWSYKHYQPVSKVVADDKHSSIGRADNNESGSAEDMSNIAAFSLIDKYLTGGR